MNEELVVRFFAALEDGDIAALREIYAPDAVIWHNDDLIEQPVDENLKVLQGLHRAVSGLHYEIIRRVPAPDGVLQQHVLRGRLRSGAEVELHAAMYLQVRDGHITRIEEYLDSGKRAAIKAAREALSAYGFPSDPGVNSEVAAAAQVPGLRAAPAAARMVPVARSAQAARGRQPQRCDGPRARGSAACGFGLVAWPRPEARRGNVAARIRRDGQCGDGPRSASMRR